jgi:hypothetical protein
VHDFAIMLPPNVAAFRLLQTPAICPSMMIA